MPSDKKNDPAIAKIGRQGLIKKVAQFSSFRSEKVLYGIGDDAAIIRNDDNIHTLLTSKTFIEGVEFDLSFMPFHQIGAKAVSAAVSNIYAMNGQPYALLIDLAIPNRVDMNMIQQLYKGFGMACSDYQCQIAGGDITASHHALTLSVTACGEVSTSALSKIGGAASDDAICVSGDVGSALAGLKILLREKKHWQDSGDPIMQPDLTEWDYVVKRQLVPVARKDVIAAFEKFAIRPSAMTDISKGIAPDLKRMMKASGKGAYIYQAALPIDTQTRKTADEMEEDVDTYALYGGEDYELLFTLPQDQLDLLAKNFKDFTVIGKVTPSDGKIEMQNADGNVILL